MGTYTFKEENGTLHRYRNDEYDGLASNPELQLWQKTQRRCAGCRHFGADGNEEKLRYRTCTKAMHLGDDTYDESVPVHVNAYVVDGYGYYAALRVAEDFGCVSFENQENP